MNPFHLVEPLRWYTCQRCRLSIETSPITGRWRDTDGRLNCRVPGNPAHTPAPSAAHALTDPTPVTSHPHGPTLGDLRTAAVDAMVAPIRAQLDELMAETRAQVGNDLVDAVVAMVRAAGAIPEDELMIEWGRRTAWFLRLLDQPGPEATDLGDRARLAAALSISTDRNLIGAPT